MRIAVEIDDNLLEILDHMRSATWEGGAVTEAWTRPGAIRYLLQHWPYISAYFKYKYSVIPHTPELDIARLFEDLVFNNVKMEKYLRGGEGQKNIIAFPQHPS